MKLRINKLISDAGLGSRRDVEEYIRQGRVKINGRRAHLGDMVEETDVVLFDEVDLPVKELIREHVALEKVQAYERQDSDRSRTKKGRAAERAESQRLQHASKSAALRKTSKNNPENKRRARMLAEQQEDEATVLYPMRTKDMRKHRSLASKPASRSRRGQREE